MGGCGGKKVCRRRWLALAFGLENKNWIHETMTTDPFAERGEEVNSGRTVFFLTALLTL
jgi:hypothetical protein